MSVNNLTYSQNGIRLTESFEGCKLTAYQDQVGVFTIGYGHTKGVKKGDTCSLQDAEDYLRQDIQACVVAINRDVTVVLNQNQFDALVDFAFNLGIGALERSTLWKKLNMRDFAGASLEFPKWNKAGGKPIIGLLRRRNAEKLLFEKE